MMMQPTFNQAIRETKKQFVQRSLPFTPERWQGVDISKRPEAKMYEILNHSFQVPLISDKIEHYQKDIEPNLPWADDHFEERICGEPINPGEQWKHWPWGNSANNFRDEEGKFNHNYMERYWPKYANKPDDDDMEPHRGIRYDYGDLDDVIKLLISDPGTRQAYMPVFFPEDTGSVHRGRVPCSLGYHFIIRNGLLHVVYYLRSCDIYRHFRDDIYLTVR